MTTQTLPILRDLYKIIHPSLREVATVLGNHKEELFFNMKFMKNGNPRLQSTILERHAVTILGNKCLGVTFPENTNGLADILINGDQRFPINLKFVSEKNMNAANNLVFPTNALHHMFFNQIPGRMTDMQLAENIYHKNFSSTFNDIGFVIFTKETGNVYYCNMMGMSNVVVNSRNGFQFSLNRLQVDKERSEEESRDYFVDLYKEFQRKRAEPYTNWFMKQ